MSDLVERLRALTAEQIEDNLDYIREADKLALEAAAEIERLTAANAALMAERASLIETKREQIKRLNDEVQRLADKITALCTAPVVAVQWRDNRLNWHTTFEGQQGLSFAQHFHHAVKMASIHAGDWRALAVHPDLDAWVSTISKTNRSIL